MKKEKLPFVGRIEAAGISRGRRSNTPTTIAGFKGRITDLLNALRREVDVYSAIELITEQHPDASMAIQSYIRLANNGHTMEIYASDGERNVHAEGMWNEFAARPVDTNVKGFDGLIDQTHDSQFRFGGMGVECVISKKAKDIDGIFPILPQWLSWEQDAQGKWRAFQQQVGKRVELTKGNFFWIALDNKVGQPTGKLLMEPSLVSLDRQLQFFEDLSAVLRRMGYPRNDISIDREAVIKSMPAAVKQDAKRTRDELNRILDLVQSDFRKLGPLDDYIHYDDMTINKTQGENTRGIDARSYLEMIDPQVINGLSTMSIMLNRTTGITETWGTVQFKILIHNIQNAQRGSKRLAENICNLWLRVNGIQGKSKFTHNPVDWESEIKKLEAALKKQEYHRRNEEYGWQGKPEAAKDGANISNLPDTPPDGRTAYINKIGNCEII